VKKFSSFSFKTSSFAASFVMLLGMMSWGGTLNAQQTPNAQPPAPQTQPPSAQPQQQATPGQPSDTQAPPATPDAQTPSATPSTPGQPTAAQPSASDSSASASGSQVFTGTVMKQGDKYVFQDGASGTTYDIDHQDQVKNFDGKKVRVHGTLDPATKTIHVQ
jgi:uncharacterized protein YdeI (BOF family)